MESVDPDGVDARAGLQPGDVLLTWTRAASPPANAAPVQGTLASPFDLREIKIEQAPRGAITLSGTRRTQPITITPPSLEKLTTIPRGLLKHRARYEEGKRLIAANEIAEGAARWRELAAELLAAGQADLACWLAFQAAKASEAIEKEKPVEAIYAQALAAGEATGQTTRRATVLEAIGDAWLKRRAFPQAERAYRLAIQHHTRGTGENLQIAEIINNLGIIAYYRGDLDTAQGHWQHTLTIRTALAPGSLPVAKSYSNLGVIDQVRGDLAAAETRFRQALGIMEPLTPGSLAVASILNNLGVVAKARGNLKAAEDFYRRALTIKEALAPQTLDTTSSLTNLGVVARDRGDLATAEALYRRALAIQEALDPGGLDVAANLHNLGSVAKDRGDFAVAEEYFQEALAIWEGFAPHSLDVALGLYNLGTLAADRGEPAAAETLYHRALAIQREQGPGSLAVADTLYSLGVAARERNQAEAAKQFLGRALVIRERLAPGSRAEAQILTTLGQLHRTQGDLEAARRFYLRAVAALEAQRGMLGGGEAAAHRLAAAHADTYRGLIEILVESDQPAEGFHVLERSRARRLLAMLAERDLIFSADLSPDLDRRRRLAAVTYDRTLATLATLSPETDAEQIDAVHGTLRELRRQHHTLEEEIRAAAPRLAALRYPHPHTLAQARASLDPGTLLLAFSTGSTHITCFAVTGRGKEPETVTIPLGRTALRGRVELLRRAIQLRDPQARALEEELYTTLLKPFARRIARARRLLISADGPLHLLPFAALRDPRRKGEHRRWLSQMTPVHHVLSTTLYAQLQQGRRRRESPRLIAFGDPVYPEDVAITLRGGRRLGRLPSTRTEVETLARLYAEQATVALGTDATEERAKAVGADAAIIHFACHGIVDERFPLDSALALSIPEEPREGKDNGLLQAWEIFERLRLDADLVTLSACDTGLGQEMGGEGIVGLTRAFQYAGARSLLVSLWPIADASTATFMRAFYSELKGGASKDVALQRAQATLRANPQTAAPYYWAPFVLIGDWR